jgi:membrane protease YdiL (CAAX protease family)
MLALLAPVIWIVSFSPDFIDYYPTYKRTNGAMLALYYHIPEIVSKFIYETFYLSDFLYTELFFRGFLVIGMTRLLGKNAVIPMAAAYAVLHFGKPLGEAVGSVFGGYILGIIALYSRNIWGGVFIHGGIALLMELFAFWQLR